MAECNNETVKIRSQYPFHLDVSEHASLRGGAHIFSVPRGSGIGNVLVGFATVWLASLLAGLISGYTGTRPHARLQTSTLTRGY